MLDPAGLRRVTTVLCGTEITSWGVLYYAFPVLAPSIVADSGWSLTEVVAAFTIAQLVAGVVGIPVGRWLDVHGPRVVMTTGSVLAVPALVAVAAAPTLPWFIVAWALVGVAMSGVLYPPAFAALTRWGGERRVAVLTVLTLVAGLASTVFAPLTALLAAHLDWRQTYVVLAGVLLLTIPAHLWGLRGPWARHHRDDDGHQSSGEVWRSRPFLVLLVAMAAVGFSVYAVLINLVPLLLERGLSTGEAAVALGIGGLGQVAGRLGYRGLVARQPLVRRTVLIFGAAAVTTAALAVAPGGLVLLCTLSFLVGSTRGIFTLVQATAVSDRWGTRDFGRLNGILSGPVLLASALAPWAGAALAAALGGHGAGFLVLAGIAAAATVLVPATVPRGARG